MPHTNPAKFENLIDFQGKELIGHVGCRAQGFRVFQSAAGAARDALSIVARASRPAVCGGTSKIERMFNSFRLASKNAVTAGSQALLVGSLISV
jgi:hypothetical protein